MISANQQLNDIIEFLPDATFVVDKRKRVIAWNRAIEEMTGSQQEEHDRHRGLCLYAFLSTAKRRPHLLDLIDASNEELESKYHICKERATSSMPKPMSPAYTEAKGLMSLHRSTAL